MRERDVAVDVGRHATGVLGGVMRVGGGGVRRAEVLVQTAAAPGDRVIGVAFVDRFGDQAVVDVGYEPRDFVDGAVTTFVAGRLESIAGEVVNERVGVIERTAPEEKVDPAPRRIYTASRVPRIEVLQCAVSPWLPQLHLLTIRSRHRWASRLLFAYATPVGSRSCIQTDLLRN